jgi:hypothetical protein
MIGVNKTHPKLFNARCFLKESSKTAGKKSVAENEEMARTPFVARSTGAVPWTASCLDHACPLGSLLTDSLRAWSLESRAERPTVALIPTRFLGSGLRMGILDFTNLNEVVPAAYMPAYVEMTAAQIKKLLHRSQSQAWQSCPATPSSAPGWQASGIRFRWACDGDFPERDALDVLRTDSHNRLVWKAADDDLTIRVLTLAPALPLLAADSGDGARQAAQHVAISAQHILADYLRARSPLNASSVGADAPWRISPLRRTVPAGAAPIEEDGADDLPLACPPSACELKVARLRQVGSLAGLAEFHAAHAHDAAAAGATSASFLLPLCGFAGCMFALVRRRRAALARRRREAIDETSSLKANAEHSASAPLPPADEAGCATRHGESSDAAAGSLQLPPFGAARESSAARAAQKPMRTGSQRVTGVDELGP